ncbi:unnamed protein product [Parajaminaea phylloscopi]
MVYIKQWAAFQAQSLDLCHSHPEQTRFLIKACPHKEWLVLKVTNDITCLKYRARSTAVLNRFDVFSREMLRRMAAVQGQSQSMTGPASPDPVTTSGVGQSVESRDQATKVAKLPANGSSNAKKKKTKKKAS